MADLDYEHMSFKEMLKHAKRGDEWAQYLVGLEYAYPENDDDVNEKKAVKWFRKASDAGVPEASFHLAFMMYIGDGTEMDKEGAYNLILKTAMESDLADAWGLLGFMYGNGDCVKQDLDRCRELLEKGAAMGSEYTQGLLDQFNDGTLFEEDDEEEDDEEEEDEDVEDDEEEEEEEEEKKEVLDGTNGFPQDSYRIDVKRVEHEARRGNIHAIKTLAWGYNHGLYGLPEDFKKSLKWYERGIDRNNHWCTRELGALYTLRGEGYKALKIFEKGIELGSGDCCEKAGDLCYYGKAGVSQNYKEAYGYYETGHRMGHIGCTAEMGTMIYYGNSPRKDLEYAKTLLLQAARKGTAWAWRMAGLCAERQRKFEDARTIYLEGIENKAWICACQLGDLYANMRLGQSDVGRSIEYYRMAITNGEAKGYACLGRVLYEMGDQNNAENFFTEGDRNGNWDCHAWLGQIALQRGDKARGISMLEEANKNLSAMAPFFLGDYCYSCHDYSKALEYYHTSGNRNYAPALAKAGMMYYDGQGTSQHFTNARVFLEYAWELGYDQAEAAMNILKQQGF